MAINIGNLGEQLVSQWLQSKSYCILHHNWHCRWGEIDIIALDKTAATLIFVEVKTRQKNNWDNDGLEAISFTKQQKISQSAATFLSQNSNYYDLYIRFDVALIQYQKSSQKTKKPRLKQDLSLFLDKIIISHQSSEIELRLIKYLENAFEATL